MSKRIVFTGGGTAGHVTPNIALIRALLDEGWEVHYIGTRNGMERELIGELPEVTYHCISSGKLRRYFSWQNFLDPFRVLRGIGQSRMILRRVRPDVIFSKGGFVSVPVVIAAGRIPVVAHESDYSPGLSNRIASHFTDHVCVSFEDTLKDLKKHNGTYTGTPIRSELYHGSPERARAFTGLTSGKPVLLCMGGSLGAQRLNELLREALPSLLPVFDVIHLCGHGKTDPGLDAEGYVQYEFIEKELPDLFALSDVVLSRAGANSVFELLALHKPSVLVPLTLHSTRGDQLLNAEYFKRKGFAEILDQNTATKEDLSEAVLRVYAHRETYISAMRAERQSDGTGPILQIIRETVHGAE